MALVTASVHNDDQAWAECGRAVDEARDYPAVLAAIAATAAAALEVAAGELGVDIDRILSGLGHHFATTRALTDPHESGA